MLAGNHGPARPGKAALLAAEHGCLQSMQCLILFAGKAVRLREEKMTLYNIFLQLVSWSIPCQKKLRT